MRVKKSEESRKFAEAKVSDAKQRLTELDKQMVNMEEEHAEDQDRQRKEIQALKKRLAAAESSASRKSESQDSLNTQLADMKALSNVQREQLAALEEELSASKSATERLISENYAQIIVLKAELTVAAEREAESEELVAKLRAEIQELKERLEAVLLEKAELEEELRNMREENDQKAKQLASLQEELSVAEAELRNRDQFVQELETKLTKMENDQQTSQDSLREAEETMFALKENLQSKDRDVLVLQSRVESITKSFGGEFTEEEEQDLGKKVEKFTQVATERQTKFAELEKLTETQVGSCFLDIDWG